MFQYVKVFFKPAVLLKFFRTGPSVFFIGNQWSPYHNQLHGAVAVQQDGATRRLAYVSAADVFEASSTHM